MTEDIIERLSHLHVWPQSVASTYADTLTPRQIERLYDVGYVAADAANEIASLRKQLEDAREALEPHADTNIQEQTPGLELHRRITLAREALKGKS